MKRNRRQHGKTRQRIVFLLSMVVLVIAGVFTYFQLRPMVVKAVTVEAGDQQIDVENFLIDKNREGSFVTDLKTVNTNIPGLYKIKIQVGKRVQTSLLEVVDTIPPIATVSDQLALRGDVIDPTSFITEVKDATQVKVYFKEAPDTTIPGEQEVILVLEDSSKNISEKSAILTVLDINSSVVIEAGSPMDITLTDFVDNDKYDISILTNLETLDISKPAVYPVELNINGRKANSSIEVVDTTAPTATIINKEVWMGETMEASAFVSNIKDSSDVTVKYKKKPDFMKQGRQEITLVLEDDSGNKTELPFTITVKKDTESPVINGTSDKLVYIGDSISYKKGVYVTDNRDEKITFSVNSSNVNLKKEGTYTVTYIAMDSSGNKTSKKINLEVKKLVVTENMVNKLCDDILDKIVNGNMAERDIAFAIYKWIKRNTSYSGDSDKSDWLKEAYHGMTKGNGDCFTYFAIAQALLTRAGIDNMRVTRVGGKTRHYWNLINCGDGWYHFDSCPNRDHKETFMLTDKEVEEYTKIRGNNYYNFDKSLYPATPAK